jgi:hypothetical protein
VQYDLLGNKDNICISNEKLPYSAPKETTEVNPIFPERPRERKERKRERIHGTAIQRSRILLAIQTPNKNIHKRCTLF